MNATLNDTVPSEVESKLRGQLHAFCDQLAAKKVVTKRKPPVARRTTWVGISTVAAAVVACVVLLNSGGGDVWADVVASIGPMKWIRFTTSEDATQQIWASPEKGIAAYNNAQQIRFVDRKQRVSFDYNVAKGQLERRPFDALLDEASPVFSAIMSSVTSGDGKVAVADTATTRLVRQKLTNVEGGAKYVLDFLFLNEIDVRAEFLVDDSTRQPKSCSITAQGVITEFDVSIEDYGPASIYEVGVPFDTEFVDHVPNEKVSSLVEFNRIGRNRSEPYSGLIISHANALPWYCAQSAYRVWRDEGRWRIDRAFHQDLENLRFDIEEGRTDPPADDADHVTWWRNQTDKIRWEPFLVSDGSKEYRAKIRYQPEVIDSREAMKNATFEVVGFDPQPKNYARNPRDQYPSVSVLPEQYGFPLLGKGHELQLSPVEGSELMGTRLLVGRNMKVWMDPTQQFIAKQYQLGSSTWRIVETGQSPSGYLYPTKIESGQGGNASGTTEYFLEFEPTFPADVFTTQFAG